MSSILIKNIASLVQASTTPRPLLKGAAMAELPTINDAFLLIEDGLIKDFGAMQDCPDRADEIIDGTGRFVLPAWVDSHTHLVFAGSREQEFEDRINGLTYQEIANRGGGILNSAKRLQATSEEELFEAAVQRMEEVSSLGTGTIEMKSGYGLTPDAELKILRVIKRLKSISKLNIKSTFLGAHAFPAAFKENHQGYIDQIINEMLPKVADEGLADYIDVFCEKVAFSVAEAEQILEAGAKYGLKAKIHTNQFNCMGGIELGIRHNAISVDHLEVVNESEIKALQQSNTIATLLPSAPFFLSDHYPPARNLINAGLPVALATDLNPGTTPSGNMPFLLSLACIKLRMTPQEAINAVTVNGAYALEMQDEVGSIEKGKQGKVIITKPIPSLAYLPYAFGSNLVERVVL